MKEIIFGAGIQGKKYFNENGDTSEILAFVDNSEDKWNKLYCGRPVIQPGQIASYPYERLVVAIDDLTEMGCAQVNGILNQLKEMDIPFDKITLSDCRYSPNDARVDFLRKFSQIINEANLSGAVAECGVYRGHFSGYISRFFPNKTLYLMDTFKGFDKRDIAFETTPESVEWCKGGSIPWLMRGNAEIALLRCDNRERVHIRSGFVPETLTGLKDERFCFVNLDMDLYAPTLDALRFFHPKMVQGGIILVHDYYHTFFHGIKEAVDEFAKENEFTRLPIGDWCSIAICP